MIASITLFIQRITTQGRKSSCASATGQCLRIPISVPWKQGSRLDGGDKWAEF